MKVKWEAIDIRGGIRAKRQHHEGRGKMVVWYTGPKGSALFDVVSLDTGDRLKTSLTQEQVAEYFNLARDQPWDVLPLADREPWS